MNRKIYIDWHAILRYVVKMTRFLEGSDKGIYEMRVIKFVLISFHIIQYDACLEIRSSLRKYLEVRESSYVLHPV